MFRYDYLGAKVTLAARLLDSPDAPKSGEVVVAVVQSSIIRCGCINCRRMDVGFEQKSRLTMALADRVA